MQENLNWWGKKRMKNGRKPVKKQWKQWSREGEREREWEGREDRGNSVRHRIPSWCEVVE